MNTKELIEIARECCSYPVKVSDYHWCGEGEFIFTEAGLNAFAQRIEQPLRDQLKQQAKAALSGMAAAKRVASQMLKDAEASKPELVESERQANAVLTEENEKLQQRIAELTQRANKAADNLEQAEKRLSEIAFKACANLDTKNAQIAQLKEALQNLRDVASQCDSWESFPSSALDAADKVLEETQ